MSEKHRKLTRREFLRISMIVASGTVISACAAPTTPEDEEPMATTAPTDTAEPEPTMAPTDTPVPEDEEMEEPEPTATPEPTSQYRESPMLTDQVDAGDLPPVDDRLPMEPLVVPVAEECGVTIGQYGGQLDTLEWRPGAHASCTEAFAWNPEGLSYWSLVNSEWEPNLATSWELSDDYTTLTIHLRRGVKWSDGTPLTTEDVQFWWEDIINNENITPQIPRQFAPDGNPAEFIIEDDFNFRIEYQEPYVAAADSMGFAPFAPKHYLQQWHIDYNEDADAVAQDEGYDEWWEAFLIHMEAGLGQQDWDLPLLAKWIPDSADEDGTRYMVRNPYYWKIDPEGNQLPYVDNYVRHIVASQEVMEAKQIAGDYNLGALMGQGGMKYFTMLKENADKAGYTVHMSPGGAWGSLSWCFNYTSKDPMLKEVFNDIRFRKAMYYAIDQDEYNEIFYLGMAKTRQGLVPPTWTFYEEGLDQTHVKYDVAEANRLLDEMGLEWDAAEEHRLLPNGEPFILQTETSGENKEFGLVIRYWKEVGIEVNAKPVDHELYAEHLLANELPIGTWGGGSPSEVGAHGSRPMRLVPPWHWPDCCALCCTPWEQWYDSQGEEGEEPPEDPKRLYELWDLWTNVPFGSEEYLEYGREMNRLNAEGLWWFVVVGQQPMIFAVGNEVKNFRGEGSDQCRLADVCRPPYRAELLYIEK